MREREAKLRAGPAFALPARERLGPRVASTETDEILQHAVYFDSRDLRLARSGVSLRFRSDDGWTVKLPTDDVGGPSVVVRTEHSFSGSPAAPPTAASNLVRAWIRTEPLVEVAWVDTQRRRTRLTDHDGRVLGEIDDDHVTGGTGPRADTRFREIEVELAEDAPVRLLDDVVSALRHAGARRSRPPMSKVARVLADEAQRPPDLPPDRPLMTTATIRELVGSTLTRSLRQLFGADPRIRLGDDVDAVHDARVATRRLRSELATFESFAAPDRTDALRRELVWLGAGLGRVRDSDVLLAALATKARLLPSAHRDPAERLVRKLRDERVRQRAELDEILVSRRYAVLLDRLVEAAVTPPLVPGCDRERAIRAAAGLDAAPRRRLRRAVRRLPADPSDRDLHEIRKRAKHARYACETSAAVLGRPAQRAAKRFAQIQEVLGAHQDAVIAQAWLLESARDAGDRDEAFVAGQLAGLFLTDQAAARAAWPATWKSARHA